MTTNFTPADPGRRLRAADDPAEMIAEARLSLHETPVDCLLLAGTGGRGRPPVLTRSSLRELLGPRGPGNLRRHLTLLRERGGEAVHALIVVADGHQSVLPSLVHDVLTRAGAQLHDAVADLAPEGPALLTLRGAADGRRWAVVPCDYDSPPAAGPGGPRPSEDDGAEVSVAALRPDGPDLRVLPIGPLREFSATRAAAAAVLDGRAIPRPAPSDPLLGEIGRTLRLPPPDLASAADPGRLLAEAGAALATLRGDAAGAAEGARMTECERIAQLLAALAVDRLHWELLAQLVEHDGAPAIDRETLLQELVRDPTRRPHEDVCAGGRLYVLLEEMRCVAAAALEGAEPRTRGTARPAWRALTALLVLLGWWNHRFASAGSLVDELREREPDSTLAPLLTRMTDTPVFPAWWPSS